MKKRYKTLQEIFEEVKKVAVDNNLSIHDFQDNTGVDSQLLRIFFNDSTDVVASLSRVIEFSKLKLHSRKLKFKPYRITDQGEMIKVTRVVSPRCFMYYSKETAKFYQFEYSKRQLRKSKTTEDIIKSEIKNLLERYLDKSVRRTFNDAKNNLK